MKKELILVIATAAIALCACSVQKKDDGGSAPSASPQTDAAAEETALKVGDITVSRASIDFIKDALGGDATDDDAKKQAENMCKVCAIGSAMDIKVDTDSMNEMKGSYTAQGMPDELAELLVRTQLTSAELEKLIKKDLVKEDPSLIENVKQNKWRAKHVLVMTQDVEEDKLPEKKELAEEILKKAQDGEDFDKLIEEYGEDPGMKSNPDGYVFGAGEMVPEFEDGTKNTPIGEFTLVKTDYGYHIIQPLEIDDESAVGAIDITEDQYNSFIDEKLKEFNITVE